MVGCKMGGRGQRGGQPTTCTCFLELEKTKAQAGLSSLLGYLSCDCSWLDGRLLICPGHDLPPHAGMDDPIPCSRNAETSSLHTTFSGPQQLVRISTPVQTLDVA